MLYTPFDPLYLILVLPAFIFSLWAQAMVSGRFKKYSAQRTINGVTGADAARQVMERAGVHNVQIERAAGNLSDHYDPRTNVIRLSENVYDTASVAAVGVAAHEAGHAIQYASSYAPIRLRAAIIPVTNIGSKLSVPLIIIGMLLEMTGLINIGIILFGTVVVFQLITLPVEFNASRRAVSSLSQTGLLNDDELSGSKKVLSAAALTYIGALAVSLAQLIRLLAVSRRRR
ncbi:MAG: zinc metallopeptidase [Eubacteriales bacterium]|jgi:Zn-dependent membrane protease YugP|nr:zinc metallopeptidase [Eubacteriales bacterium]